MFWDIFKKKNKVIESPAETLSEEKLTEIVDNLFGESIPDTVPKINLETKPEINTPSYEPITKPEFDLKAASIKYTELREVYLKKKGDISDYISVYFTWVRETFNLPEGLEDNDSLGKYLFNTYTYFYSTKIGTMFSNIYGKQNFAVVKKPLYSTSGGFRNLTLNKKTNNSAEFSPHLFGLALDYSYNQFMKSAFIDYNNFEQDLPAFKKFAKDLAANADYFSTLPGIRLMLYPRHVHYDFCAGKSSGLVYLSLTTSYTATAKTDVILKK